MLVRSTRMSSIYGRSSLGATSLPIALAIWALVSVASFASPGERQALEFYRQAAAAFRDRSWTLESWKRAAQRADSLFGLAFQAAESESLRVKALYMMARCRKDEWKSAEAESLYWRVVQEFPHSYLADDAFFQVAYLESDIDSSITLYKRFLKRYPNSEHAPGATYRLGCLLYIGYKKEYSTGRMVLRKLLRRYPKSDEAAYAPYCIGDSYRKEGLIDSAIVWFKQFAKASPTFTISALDEILGDLYQKRHDWKKSVDLYRQIRGLVVSQKKKGFELPSFASKVEATLLSPKDRIETLKWEIGTADRAYKKFANYAQMGDIYAQALWSWPEAIAAWRSALAMSGSLEDRMQLSMKIANAYLFEMNKPDSALKYYAVWQQMHPEKKTIWGPDWTAKQVVAWDQSVFVNAAISARRAAACKYATAGNAQIGAAQTIWKAASDWPRTLLYRVQHGQTLYSISGAVYGQALYWRMLFSDNDTTLTHPDTVRTGQRIVVRAIPDLFKKDEGLRMFMMGDSAVLSHSYRDALETYAKALRILSREFARKDEDVRAVTRRCRELEGKIGKGKDPSSMYEYAKIVYRLAMTDPARIVAMNDALGVAKDSSVVARLTYTIGRLYHRNGAYSKAASYYERCAATGAAGSLLDDALFYVAALKYGARNEHVRAAHAFEKVYKKCGAADFGARALLDGAVRYEYGGQNLEALRCYRLLYSDEKAPLGLRFAGLYDAGVLKKYVLGKPDEGAALFKQLLQLAESQKDHWTWESGGEYVWLARQELEQ